MPKILDNIRSQLETAEDSMTLLVRLSRKDEVIASIRRNIHPKQLKQVREGFFSHKELFNHGELIHLKGKQRITLGKF